MATIRKNLEVSKRRSVHAVYYEETEDFSLEDLLFFFLDHMWSSGKCGGYRAEAHKMIPSPGAPGQIKPYIPTGSIN